VAASMTAMQCQADVATGQFNWSLSMDNFQCVRACHLVLGGKNNASR